MHGLAKPDILSAAMAQAIRPRRRLTVSEWADAHRILPAKGSSEKGQWRTSRTPYLREIMDALSDSSTVQRVVFMSCTQVGKTEVGLNWTGYIMEHAPGPLLTVLPTLDVRKRWVLQRLKPMIDETPVLSAIFDTRRTRDGANSEDMKDFPGGVDILSGANSPSSLASMPVRYVLCDEVDRFPWEVGHEGDPLGLIDERTKTFPRRKVLLVSTPTIKGASRIDEEFEASDMRYYHVPCPHCGSFWPFKWPQVKWDGGLTRAWYVCEECGAEIEEHNKTAMLEAGRWIPARPAAAVRGYTINALYSPIGLGWSWLELARTWIGCQGDRAKLKRFINTALAEAWEDRSRKQVDAHDLAARADDVAMRNVPPGCLIVTAGVDTQDDRLELHVIGHGADRRWWVLDYLVLPGDPSRDEVWLTLAEALNTPLRNAWGKDLHIKACAIDMGGHHTEDVKAFTLSRRTPRCKLMAVQGSRHRQGTILNTRPQKKDHNWRGKVIKNGVEVWQVGTEVAKDKIYNDLAGDADLPAEQRRVRFPTGLPENYFAQLMSEVFDPEKNRYILRKGKRNEALDTAVYAHAAAHHPTLRVDKLRAPDWERLRQVLEGDAVPDAEALAASIEAAPAATAEPAKPSAPKPRQTASPLAKDEWSRRL